MSEVLRSFSDFKSQKPTVVCLGNFDGVHRGHQKILQHTRELASKKGYHSVVFSFFPHPKRFFKPASLEPKLILNQEERIEILSQMNLDTVLLQDFDLDFSKIEAQEFIDRVLVQSLGAKVIVVGPEFCFGRGAKGNVSLLKKQKDLQVEPVQILAFDREKISSSEIRKWIELGQMHKAQVALGYFYFVSGTVEEGSGRGRQLNFPTANLKTDRECLPQYGVYAGLWEDRRTKQFYPAVLNIGNRPSFDAGFSIEAHLIDFADSLNGRESRFYFISRIREERKFASGADLKVQIEKDVEKAILDIQNSLEFTYQAPAMKNSLKHSFDALQGHQAFDFL